MKINRIIISLIVLVPFFLLPFNPHGNSMCNSLSGAIYCKDSITCRHEIGHLMDYQNGHPSRSAEFTNTLRAYLYVQIKYADLDDPYTNIILAAVGYDSAYFSPLGYERFSSPPEEIYAHLYAYVDGDLELLPFAFKEFFSRDKKYTDLHACLMSAPVNLCGTALHIEKR